MAALVALLKWRGERTEIEAAIRANTNSGDCSLNRTYCLYVLLCLWWMRADMSAGAP